MAKRRYKHLSARSKEILAEKRRAAKILREAGLLRRRSGRITREYLQSSSYFRKLRREFADVISGETRAASIDFNAARLFRSAGYRVKRAPGGKARVIVPTAAPRVTARTAPRIALQPPPAAPAPRAVRPRAARPPRPTRARDQIDEIATMAIDYFRATAGRAATEDRAAELLRLIYRYPQEVLQIVRVSQADAERYRQGLGPAHQQELPSGFAADMFREDFPELYYYHSLQTYYIQAA